VVSLFIVGVRCWPEIIICFLLIVGVIAAYVWFCFLFEGDFGFGGSLILATLWLLFIGVFMFVACG